MDILVHEYLGYGIHQSKCMVYIKEVTNPRYGSTTFVCFENMDEGTSITNASEQLASEIVQKYGLDPENTRFFETYDREQIDEISYSWQDLVASSPKWFPSEFDLAHVFNFK